MQAAKPTGPSCQELLALPTMAKQCKAVHTPLLTGAAPTQEQSLPPDWAKLPSGILEDIAWKDMTGEMLLVCRAWRDSFRCTVMHCAITEASAYTLVSLQQYRYLKQLSLPAAQDHHMSLVKVLPSLVELQVRATTSGLKFDSLVSLCSLKQLQHLG